MSKCNNFGRSFYDSLDISTNPPIFDIRFIKNFIPPFDANQSGIWKPIIIHKNQSNTIYGSLLGNPRNIDDSKSSPCNCSAEGSKVKRNVSFAYNDLSDEQEDGIYCEYCQGLYPDEEDKMECYANVEYRPRKGSKKSKTNFLWPLVEPVTDPPTGEGELYEKDCCEGGCDTRMKTDDITPKIPYLYNNYLYKLLDFKYMKQFPAIENPGLGMERFVSFNKANPLNGIFLDGNISVCIDWTIKARLGEIPLDGNDTYHENTYIHKKSYSRYLSNNKTAGNFILENVNNATPIAQWQLENMPLLSGALTYANNYLVQQNFDTSILKNIIPSVDQFTIPYGITDDTHYNIFLKSPNGKNGGYWKWNYSSGVLFWYRYYDIDKPKDKRLIPGIDLYISDGDVFFATNDGPEPLPLESPDRQCVPKACPSGLKLTNYQVVNSTSSVTIVPSGSEFIYISANIYEKVHKITEKLCDFYSRVRPNEKTYKDIFNTAAILATGPQYDGITVDLYKKTNQYTAAEKEEFIRLINEINTGEGLTVQDFDNWVLSYNPRNIEELNFDVRKNMLNKKMPSYNNLNMIQTSGDLINTLVHKYGCYAWIPPKSQGSLTIDKKILPHATLDINFEPVVNFSDVTRNYAGVTQPRKSCDALRRGSTKIFSYDQHFSIGESYLYTSFLNEGLAYNAVCTNADPPRSEITEVGNVVSVYFREHQIFSKGFNNFQTVFEDRYSRFPSVSSTLDTTFSDLESVEDSEGNDNVFFLNPDRLLRVTRAYNAIAYNPSIDLVAFHKDGGCYYDSTFLTKYPGTGTVSFITDWKPPNTQKYNPVTTFKTYDMGIKIYGISSESLRSSDNLNCRTLPLNQSCSCWGLNKVENFDYRCSTNANGAVVYETPKLFTPFLSTKDVPLQAYGGYSVNKVQELLGDFRIPSHSNPGEILPKINKEISVTELNGCSQTFNVSLPNYVATKWVVRIDNLDPEGADIWVSYSDSYGFAGNTRTQNRLVINGQEIFPNEQAYLQNPSETLEISIYNQLLTSIFDSSFVLQDPDEGMYLYTPSMFSCSKERSTENFTANTGPSSISLTITRIPKVNTLNFAISGIPSLGKIVKGHFDSNIGMEKNKKNPEPGKSELKLNKYNGLFNFDYGKLFFGSDSENIHLNNTTYKATINLEEAGKLSSYTNLLRHNKKLRLYFKIGNVWYEYEDHRTFGYFNEKENNQYVSWPSIFRETYLPSEESIGPFIPATPKIPLAHEYFFNTQDKSILSSFGQKSTYPYATAYFYVADKNDKKKIRVEGSRLFFMLPNVENNLLYRDNNILQQGGKIFPNIINEDNIKYNTLPYTGVIGNSGIPVSGTKINLDRQIDLNLYDPKTEDFKIIKPISKAILVNTKKYAENINNPLIQKYNNIYTELEFEEVLPDEGYIGINQPNLYNLTVFATTEANNVNYEDLIKILPDKTFSNKWADIYYRNNTADILNNRPYYYSLNGVYGPFTHENILNYVIANNFLYSYQLPTDNGLTNNYFDYDFYFKNKGNVSFPNPAINYYIHRDFSINNENNLLGRYNLYKNSNPIIDINIYNANLSEVSESFATDFKAETGVLCIKGINKPTYEYPKGMNNKFDFFIDLNPNFRLKPVAIKEDKIIYSKSFVLTDPYASLAGLKLITTYNENVDTNLCTDIVTPNVSMPPVSIEDGPFNWSYFRTFYTYSDPYVSYPIYCNIDKSSKCGESTVANQCTMNPIGKVDVSSIFATHLYKYKNISELPGEIEFSLSIDAGLYCPLFISGQIPYITRSEFGGYSPLFPNNTLRGSSDCINGSSYPRLQRGLSVWDDIYQYETQQNIIDPKPIDNWANEMVFRAIHGSKQKINLRDISKYTTDTERSYSSILANLLNETKNNISSVYEYIPYDYDRTASLKNIKVDGSFRILGPANIGDRIKINFNNNIYNIIIRDDGQNIIAECPELNVKGLLHEKFTETTSIYIREKDSTNISSVVNDNTTERVVDVCYSPRSFSVSTDCRDSDPLSDGSPGLFQSCTSISAGGPYTTPGYTTIYGSDCAATFAGFNHVINVDNSLSIIPISVSNNVPCSAFSIETADPSKPSNLDSFLTRYAISSVVGVSDSNQPLECGRYAVYPCSAESNCCGGSNISLDSSDFKTVVAKRLSYRIKNCHYDLTMKGLVSNSLFNVASYTTTIPDYECIEMPPGDTGPDNETFELYKKCCNQGSSPGDYYGGGQEADSACIGFDSNSACCAAVAQYGDQLPPTCFPLGNWVKAFDCRESYWVISCRSKSTVYEIVERTTKTESSSNYLAGCNRVVGIFTYNNNEVKLSLGIRKIKTITNASTGGQGSEDVVEYNGYNCKEVITRGCPYIKVELPNNSYGIDEYQSTQCQNCSTKSSDVEIISNPEWQFQIDNNICILGSLLIGNNPNQNTTSGFDGCVITEGSQYTDSQAGDNANLGVFGNRECGSFVPYAGFGAAETLWHVAIKHPLLGNTDAGVESACNTKLVANGAIGINFPSWTSNSTAKSEYINGWKATIEQRYDSKYYCSNNYDYDEKDLIEGVIPGSCRLQFSTLSWPATKFKLKAKLNESKCGVEYEVVTEDTTVSVLVAYMTYRYKRPLSLEDKIIDELGPSNIDSSKCRTYFSAGLPKNNCANGLQYGHFTNVVEKLISKLDYDGTCSSGPQCYDKARRCEPGEYCCKVDLYGNTYLRS